MDQLLQRESRGPQSGWYIGLKQPTQRPGNRWQGSRRRLRRARYRASREAGAEIAETTGHTFTELVLPEVVPADCGPHEHNPPIGRATVMAEMFGILSSRARTESRHWQGGGSRIARACRRMRSA